MALFSKKVTKEDRVLIIDVGSGSVGAALMVSSYDEMLARNTPRIVFSTRVEIASTDTHNFIAYIRAMLAAAETAVQKVHNAKLPPPNRVQAVLAAPWYASQTRIIEYSKKVPFTFTKKIWYELLMKEVELFQDGASKTFESFDGALRLIERNNMDIKLNGYTVAHPFAKKTSEVSMSVYMSIAPEYLVRSLEEIIAGFFERPIEWSTYLFASYAVVRDFFVGQKNYLLVDIGGEVTDIGLVKNEILSEALTFPKGKNTLIRTLMEHLAISWDEADSHLRLYTSGMLTEKHRERVRVAVAKILGEWSQSFERSLAHLTHDFTLPETIFVTVDTDVRALYEEAVHNEAFTQFTLSHKRFNVILIDASALHEYCALEQMAEKDHFLMIDALYAASHHTR